MADLQEEIDALDRVLFRLASVDDERLVVVLDALLPRLLALFPAATASPLEHALKDKILQVISHIKTRLHGISSPRLPLLALSAVVDDEATRSPFAANFAFMFLEIGFAAATQEEQTTVLTRLAKSLDRRGPALQKTFFRLLLGTFPATTTEATQILAEAPTAADVVLDFLLDVVVYQPITSNSTVSDPVLYGLMAPRIERLRQVKVTDLSREALYDCQLHALQFVKNLGRPYPTRVLHFVAGVSSFHHVVKAFCEDHLQRVVNEDSSALENPDVCRGIMALVMSSPVVAQGRALEGRDALILGNRSRIADASILAAANLLKVSKAATNVLPIVLQVICQLMFADEPTSAPIVKQRIKIAGAQLCEWSFHHCSEQYLVQVLGPVLLPTLLRTLMDPNADLDSANAPFWREFRQHIYETVSVLTARAPSLLTASEQAFQVLLVRCLVEEKSRSGVNALKALSSLRETFEKCGSQLVVAKIRLELTGLLQGAKLYEASNNYQRVRMAVGEWSETVIKSTQARAGIADESDLDVKLRMALLKLCGDEDEAIRRSAEKALYARPLPELTALTQRVRSVLGSEVFDLRRVMGVREAQQCLLFLQEALKEFAHRENDSTRGRAHQEALTYFVETLLPIPATNSASHDSSELYAKVSTQLIQLHGVFPHTVDTLLHGRAVDICATMERASSNRQTLLGLSTLLGWSLANRWNDSMEIIATGAATVRNSSSTTSEFCAALYAVGTAVAMVSAQPIGVLQGQVIPLESALSCLSSSLRIAVANASNFAALPRGEHSLKVVFDRIAGCIDAVGISGNWNCLLAISDSNLGDSLRRLREETLEDLGKVIGWKLDGVTADGNVKSRLSSVRLIALEATGLALSGSSWAGIEVGKLEALILDIIALGKEQQLELQFAVSHTLMAVGTCKVDGKGSTLVSQLVARVLRDCADARQATVRRSACVWLLCMCSAGLSTLSAEAWKVIFHDPEFSKTIVRIHEFFVAMLNDADPVTTECAVKGLAYLRLKAPTPDIGTEFSDSLFRRLRCFRAFVPLSSTNRTVHDEEDNDGEASPPPTNNRVTGQSSTGQDSVDNVAYREVSNVAADIGDPELMYSLLYLSTMDPIWQTLLARQTDSSRLEFFFPAVDRAFRAEIIEQANRQWTSEAFEHRKKLIPWLFLLKNHSSPKVSEVMNNLWTFAKGELFVSTSQEKSLLSDQWDTILQFLLSKLEHSRNFKYREACCVALIDLLNGVGSAQVEPYFLRLWKLASRSVDDVMEAVAVAGLKFFKALGELSLRIAVKHEGCRRELLDYLISHGMTSKNVVCSALSIDLLLRLVKEVDAQSLEDRLGALVLQLLEYLSSLEMPELQYAQFHVGDKKDQLERLRVSMSQSGPVGQLLDQCMLKLKALAVGSSASCVRIVEEVSRGVVNLLKFGVGLNTRVGTANFVATLATELPFELRKCGGAELILSRSLLPYVADRSASENDHYGDEAARYSSGSGVPDGLVLQSYLRAAAYMCALAEPSTVKNYVQSGVFAVHRRSKDEASMNAVENGEGGGFASNDTYTSRFLMVSALASKELVTKCPPITDFLALVAPDRRNEWYASDVFPAAFIGQHASSETLRSAWKEILEELPPGITYAESALVATLAVLARWIRHPSWDTRRQGVKALQSLFSSNSSYRSKLSAHQTDQIWNELLSAIPGRVWRGKGVILEALVAIAHVRADETHALFNLFLDESDRGWKIKDNEYLESAMLSLASLAAATPSSTEESQVVRFQVVAELRRRFELWLAEATSEDGMEKERAFPPMLIKVVFETLGSVVPQSVTAERGSEVTHELLQWLDSCVANSAFHVWSVRRSIFTATASVIRSAPAEAFSNHQVISRLVDRSCGDLGVGDAKYSMVRVAAGDVLVALASRHNEPQISLQLTTQRERLSAAVDVLRGSDEPKEQQVAAQIFSQLANSVAA